jgi:uncharacterized protein (DUF302 family)
MIIEKLSPWEFDKTVELLLVEAAKLSWNIPAVHDLRQSLAKAGKSVAPVKVIEICKPEYSGKMLEKSDERIISVMMPCRISVYLKEDGNTYIALINVADLVTSMPETIRTVMLAVAEEVNGIIESVIG